jgi:hypothetical protein
MPHARVHYWHTGTRTSTESHWAHNGMNSCSSESTNNFTSIMIEQGEAWPTMILIILPLSTSLHQTVLADRLGMHFCLLSSLQPNYRYLCIITWYMLHAAMHCYATCDTSRPCEMKQPELYMRQRDSKVRWTGIQHLRAAPCPSIPWSFGFRQHLPHTYSTELCRTGSRQASEFRRRVCMSYPFNLTSDTSLNQDMGVNAVVPFQIVD